VSLQSSRCMFTEKVTLCSHVILKVKDVFSNYHTRDAVGIYN
jgi:hypothetical protein